LDSAIRGREFKHASTCASKVLNSPNVNNAFPTIQMVVAHPNQACAATTAAGIFCVQQQLD